MKASHQFTDQNKRMIVSHKDHGGVRIRVVTHGVLPGISGVVDFFLSADEVPLLKDALNQVERVK